MPIVERSVLIERTPIQMFDLVDRCEDYPLFLPWCGGSTVHERTERLTVATLQIAYRGISSHFSTQNSKDFPGLMTIHLKDGPFTKLEGRWCFTPLGDVACKVEFYLHYEFSSRMLAKVLGPVFSHIANTFVESFVKRAKQVYG